MPYALFFYKKHKNTIQRFIEIKINKDLIFYQIKSTISYKHRYFDCFIYFVYFDIIIM